MSKDEQKDGPLHHVITKPREEVRDGFWSGDKEKEYIVSLQISISGKKAKATFFDSIVFKTDSASEILPELYEATKVAIKAGEEKLKGMGI